LDSHPYLPLGLALTGASDVLGLLPGVSRVLRSILGHADSGRLRLILPPGLRIGLKLIGFILISFSL